jgi:transketolase
MSPMLYSVLALTGKYSLDDLKGFRQWGSVTPGHPEVDVLHGVENTSGPLGQGHTYAVGAAIAAKFLQAKTNRTSEQKIYAYISDGGVQEEISQGAGRLAGHLGLNNLIMFYDANEIQLSTSVGDVTSENTALKYEAWGWKVVNVNGSDASQIRQALADAQHETKQPTLIIGKTLMGKGAVAADGSSFERKCATHGMPLGECGADYKKTIANLGGNPEEPFQIFPNVAKLYADRKAELRQIVDKQLAEEAAWAKANPELAAKSTRG